MLQIPFHVRRNRQRLSAIRYDWQVTTLPYKEREWLLKRGALFKYCSNLKSYRCPEADKNMHRTYIIPTSMNGFCGVCGFGICYRRNSSKKNGADKKVAEGLFFLRRGEYRLTHSYFHHPLKIIPFPCWLYDKTNIMHGDGANFGFADGHADYHKWSVRKR